MMNPNVAPLKHPDPAVRRTLRMYIIAGVILFSGTLATVAVATVPWLDIGDHGFDAKDAMLGLMIAGFKASVVLAIFMHLNHERRTVYFIGALAMVHFTGMFVFMLFSEVDRVNDPHFTADPVEVRDDAVLR